MDAFSTNSSPIKSGPVLTASKTWAIRCGIRVQQIKLDRRIIEQRLGKMDGFPKSR
ncbi:hypothetical protein ACFPMF_24260 [Larkinella bovis]|uniref:Uncharacterized protein n=1 Tax=Larkinella bovis TaxID=683041 RepID=A0ABW0IIR5_9BACT